jgi:hypothetical protein
MSNPRDKRHKKLDKYEIIVVKAKIEPRFFKNPCQSPTLPKKKIVNDEEKKKPNCCIQ